jgi:hypothetical protein
MPNDLIGKIENVQELFKSIFLKQKKDVIPLKFIWDQESLTYPLLMNSRCFMEFIIKNIEDINSNSENAIDKDYTIINENKRSNINMNMQTNPNSNSFYNSKAFEKNQNFKSHSHQLNLNSNSIPSFNKESGEMIKRVLREIDDKNSEIKNRSDEISELKKEMKIIQQENNNLKVSLGKEKEYKINAIISKEIENMTEKEVKEKFAKIVQVYI